MPNLMITLLNDEFSGPTCSRKSRITCKFKTKQERAMLITTQGNKQQYKTNTKFKSFKY